MPVAVKEARVTNLTIETSDDRMKVKGEYTLVSTADKILARQSFGDYGMKIEPSRETLVALDSFIAAFKKDLNSTLGLGD